ncbi:MAG TPA: hypothetical protein VK669_13170 [Candidatus Limnocylindrales bacterium]|nr:hypothetical protein [Candidatus Limnocylindrales bacterium]
MAFLAAIAFAVPVAAPAQTVMNGNQQVAILQYAVRNIDRETRTLATLPNQISVNDITLVPVDGMRLSAAQQRTMNGTYGAARRAALRAALDKATVADTDRRNGSSEDQQSLTEYLQHHNVDPNRVVAVDVNGREDPQNPHVTVFFRGRLRSTSQGG